jgi:hypothetical protein
MIAAIEGGRRMTKETSVCFMRLAALAAALCLTSPVSAEIRCDGSFQLVGGQLIETPWCEDDNLAKVARSYGATASARAIRENPNLKQQLCRFIGYDLRVKDTCAGYRDEERMR